MTHSLLGKNILYRKLRGTAYGKVVEVNGDNLLVRVNWKILANVNVRDIINIY